MYFCFVYRNIFYSAAELAIESRITGLNLTLFGLMLIISRYYIFWALNNAFFPSELKIKIIIITNGGKIDK